MHESPTPAEHEGTELATSRRCPRYPVPDPGHPEHLPRLTDVDETAADRATRQVATFFGLVPLLRDRLRRRLLRHARDAYIDFGPLHANTQNLLLGLTFGLALLFIGIGAVQWARKLMDDRGDGRLPARRHRPAEDDDLHVDRAGQGRR